MTSREQLDDWAQRASQAQGRAAQSFARLLKIAEESDSGQARRVARFIAATWNGESFPLDLFELPPVRSTLPSLMTCLCASMPSGGRRQTCGRWCRAVSNVSSGSSRLGDSRRCRRGDLPVAPPGAGCPISRRFARDAPVGRGRGGAAPARAAHAASPRSARRVCQRPSLRRPDREASLLSRLWPHVRGLPERLVPSGSP
jgi:hypothetical protein